MNSRIKSIFSFLLAAVLVVSCMSFATNAEDTNVTLAATFILGADGTAKQNDGATFTMYTENNSSYTLEVTGVQNAYKDAFNDDEDGLKRDRIENA